MRFFYARQEHRCHFCPGTIAKGEVFVRVSFRNRQGTGVASILLHPSCYPAWSNQLFTRQYLRWKEQQLPPKELGRPKKSSDPKECHRLKVLLQYHRNLGHTARVEEIQYWINKLEGGNNGS